MTVFPHPRRPLSSLGPAVKRASGYLSHIHSKEDEDFDGSVLHPDLSGFKFCWECRHLLDMILALELEGHTELARELAATDLAERERPARLKAARKYTGNYEKFAWAFFQLFERPNGKFQASSFDDSSAPYIVRATYLAPCAWVYCHDDIRLNDTRIYAGIVGVTTDASAAAATAAEHPKPKLIRKHPRGRRHGRQASKDAASALVATSNGISVRSFLALPHHSSVPGSLPASDSHPGLFESKIIRRFFFSMTIYFMHSLPHGGPEIL